MRETVAEYEITRTPFHPYYWTVYGSTVGGRAMLWGPPLAYNPNGCIGIDVYPHGQGIGSALLSRLIEDYKAEHPEHMLYAWIDRRNRASQGLFEKHGFINTREPFNIVNEWWLLQHG